MTKFLNWLIGRTPADEDAPPPLPRFVDPLALPPEDDGEDLEIAMLQRDVGVPDAAEQEDLSEDLEPIYTIIEYIDARRRKSRRRITLVSLHRTLPMPKLRAVCHERRALRSFRIDRIQETIDPETGEVKPAAEFLRDVLGIEIADSYAASQPRQDGNDPGYKDGAPGQIRACRTALRAPLSILIAMARTDGEICLEETDAIQRYAERELQKLSETGEEFMRVGSLTVDAVCNSIPKMRPRKSSLRGCIEDIAHMPADSFDRFRIAIESVVMADGRIDAEELLLLEELDADIAILRCNRLA